MRSTGVAVLTVWVVVVNLVAPSIADNRLVPEPARPSDSLVEMIGVATHWSFHNTIYHQKWDDVQKLLGGLGVRYVRDSLDPRLNELWKMYGIRAIAIIEPGLSWDKILELWHKNRHLIAAIEGPNECNTSWKKLNKTYEGKSWPEGPHLFQDEIYRRVKDDPELRHIPVIALSTAYKGAGPEIAPLRSFDYANAHCYAGGGIPSRSLDFRDSYLLLGPGAVCPPLVATESGYHTCLGDSKVVAGNQQGISHAAHRKYIPRQLAEYFNAGFRWDVIYELAAGRPKKAEQEDPEAAFGLLLPDATPKPAYHALKRLIELLSDSRWDPAEETWIRPAAVAPRALAFELNGAPETLHHTLLQRSDGSFRLLLWNEVSCFNLKDKKDVRNAEVKVRLQLGSPARIAVHRLGPSAPPAAPIEAARELDVQVPDEVVVLEIKLSEPQRPLAIGVPTGWEAKVGPTAVELSGPPSPGAGGYWVSLQQRNLGPAQLGSDGKVHFSLKRLMPATTYEFEVVAAAADGGVSAPAKISATTTDAFPDLVVQSLRVQPESAKSGEPATLVAVVENIGRAPTEEDVTVGTNFRVDGKSIGWNDTLRGPLAPGQKVEVSPNSGPTGPPKWTVPLGAHHITAQVDDVNRIVESNEANNKKTITLASGTGPDLVVKRSQVKQAQSGKPLVIDVELVNQGSESTPPGVGVAASILAIDSPKPQLLGYAISREPISAGGTRTLTVTCDSKLTPGKHKLRAVADDVDRIPELDNANNQIDFEIDVSAGP